MSATNNQREMILKWHKGKAATPEYTAKLLGLPLSEVLYVIEHPRTAEITRGRVDTGIHRTTGLKNTDKHTRIHD